MGNKQELRITIRNGQVRFLKLQKRFATLPERLSDHLRYLMENKKIIRKVP